MRLLRHILLVFALGIGLVVVTNAPAFAVSGGGCIYADAVVRPCISVSTGTTNPLIGDFYLEHYPDPSLQVSVVELYICKLPSTCGHYLYSTSVNHLGHYPKAYKTATSQGVYETYLVFKTSWGAISFDKESPQLSWP
jgi:hypothetical protein